MPCGKFDGILLVTFKVTVAKTFGLLFVDTMYAVDNLLQKRIMHLYYCF